jgi:hypothetical protein
VAAFPAAALSTVTSVNDLRLGTLADGLLAVRAGAA